MKKETPVDKLIPSSVMLSRHIDEICELSNIPLRIRKLLEDVAPERDEALRSFMGGFHRKVSSDLRGKKLYHACAGAMNGWIGGFIGACIELDGRLFPEHQA